MNRPKILKRAKTNLPLIFQAIIKLNEQLYFPIIKDMSILNKTTKKYIIRYE